MKFKNVIFTIDAKAKCSCNTTGEAESSKIINDFESSKVICFISGYAS